VNIKSCPFQTNLLLHATPRRDLSLMKITFPPKPAPDGALLPKDAADAIDRFVLKRRPERAGSRYFVSMPASFVCSVHSSRGQ